MPPKKRIHDMLMAFQNRFPPTALMAKEIASDRVSKSTKSLAKKKRPDTFHAKSWLFHKDPLSWFVIIPI